MQLIIVRIIRPMNIHLFISFAIHLIGLAVLILINIYVVPLELPYTSIIVYILLTALLVSLSFVPLLGLRSPSSVIMTILPTGRKVTITQLQKAFDERQLIFDRLNDLCNIGLVKKRKNRYIISSQGMFIDKILEVFSVVMSLKNQG